MCQCFEPGISVLNHQVHLLQQLFSTTQMQLPFPQIRLQSRSVLQFELQHPGGTLAVPKLSLAPALASAQVLRPFSASAAIGGVLGPDGDQVIPLVPATARPAQTKTRAKSFLLMACS